MDGASFRGLTAHGLGILRFGLPRLVFRSLGVEFRVSGVQIIWIPKSPDQQALAAKVSKKV